MAKFYGMIGFGHQVEVSPGVWDDVITERPYQGDEIRPAVNSRERTEINSKFTLGNSFSILLDGYVENNLFAIRYIEWMGVRWVVAKVDLLYPRLELMVRDMYNGPTPRAPESPGGTSGE